MATFIIARLTITEAVRRRIMLAGFLLGVAFLALFGVGLYFMRNEMAVAGGAAGTIVQRSFFNFVALAGLYAVNFLAAAMGALVSADTLAGEINSGTIQAIVTKPVRRSEVVLGKWLGFAGLLALYLLLMAGGVVAITYLETSYIVQNGPAGLALMYLGALLIMTLTLACSSSLSTLATGGVVFGLYGLAFIGGWVEQFGALLQNRTAVDIGIISSLIIPNDAVWRRAAYEMTPPLAQVMGFSGGPLVTLSVPSELMIAYAGAYLALALAIAVREFSRRDL